MMCRDLRNVWDAPDCIEDAELDSSDTSSDEFANATKYVLTNAGSSIRVLGKAQARVAIGLTKSLKTIQDMVSTFHKAQNIKK